MAFDIWVSVSKEGVVDPQTVDPRLVKGIAINGQEVYPVPFDMTEIDITLILRSETDAEYLEALAKEDAEKKASVKKVVKSKKKVTGSLAKKSREKK